MVSAGYSISKLTAVIARWYGHDWSALGTKVSPGFAGLGALVTVAGILIPLAGPRLTAWHRNWRTYVRLEPLENELNDVLTRRNLQLPRPNWATSPGHRLMWRQTSIHNALTYLNVFLDQDLFERTQATALATTGDQNQADATAWAVAITAAVRGERIGDPIPGSSHEAGRLAGQSLEPSALVRVADALSTSVGDARVGTTATNGAL
jgi:hypothetical protein